MTSEAIHESYRALLRLWPVASEHLTVPTHLGETFVVASGPADAPPLVLLRSWAAATRCSTPPKPKRALNVMPPRPRSSSSRPTGICCPSRPIA